MGCRELTAQWECFLLLGNAAHFLPRQCPCIRSASPGHTVLLGPVINLAVNAGTVIGSRAIPLMTDDGAPMSRASLVCTTSHRRLLAARQALEDMLPGAKSFRCINSWPQLLVRHLDSGSFNFFLLVCKVYLTSSLMWLALTLANPPNVALFC